MKLLIDISKNDYEEIKEYGINTFSSLAIAIQNGTLLEDELEKIKAEINGFCKGYLCTPQPEAIVDDINEYVINKRIAELKGENNGNS